MESTQRGRVRPNLRATLALACALVGITAAASGQNAPPTASTTDGDASPDATEPEDADDVEEMVVVGDRRPSMDVLAGASASRIETDERLLEGAQIDDLLAEMPGVQIRRFGGVGERFEISIRGSSPEQVPVFLDGVRLDNSLTGRTDLSTLCLDVLEEIQVTRGAGAARAGSGAIGGVVNLVSREPEDEPETRLRLSAGSFESFEGSLRHARRIRDWDVSLSYCGFHTEGDFEFQRSRNFIGGVPTGSPEIVTRINNESLRQTGLARIGHPIGDGHVRATQLLTYLDRGVPGLESNQRPNSNERDLSSLTSLTFEHPVAALPSGRFESILAHRFERNHYEDDPYTPPASEAIDSQTEVGSSTLQTSLGGAFEGLAGDHEFAVLAEGRFDRRQSNEAKTKSRAGIAIRGELEASWLDERIVLSPSLRLERIGGLDLEWIPGLAVRTMPLEWLEVRGAVARSYRAPSFEELYLPDKGFERGNQNLRPEEAWSGEVGVTLRSPFESPWLDAEVEATYFAGQVDNGIAFVLISSNVLAPVNTGSYDTRGYELTLRWSPHPWFRAIGSRTVTRAKLDSDGTRVAGIAFSQTDGRIEIGPRERLKIVGEVHYTGKLPVSEGNAAVLPSRVSFDASAGIDLTKFPIFHLERLGSSLWLSVRARNLGNAALRDARSFPRPGRNFSIALESVF